MDITKTGTLTFSPALVPTHQVRYVTAETDPLDESKWQPVIGWAIVVAAYEARPGETSLAQTTIEPVWYDEGAGALVWPTEVEEQLGGCFWDLRGIGAYHNKALKDVERYGPDQPVATPHDELRHK